MRLKANFVRALTCFTICLGLVSPSQALVAGGVAVYNYYSFSENETPSRMGLNLLALGGAVTGAAAAAVGVSYTVNMSFASYVALYVAGTLGLYLGGIILDENEQDLKFRVLSEQSAKKMKLTKEEVEIFNANIDIVNAMKSEVVNVLANLPTNKDIDFANASPNIWFNLFEGLVISDSQKLKLQSAVNKVSLQFNKDLAATLSAVSR